jgi:7-cyano-7-deazaguanine synthase
MRKAVLLLSGGIDSATTLAMARDEGYAVYALSFDYGQRHRQELQAAAKIASALGVERHMTTRIELDKFGGSALTSDMEVPKNRSPDTLDVEIPSTYVPARNTIFLSFALVWCEVLRAQDIFIGTNVVDYSGYPDCRPEFLEEFEKTSRLATDFSLTHSCYDPDPRGRACGECDSCILRRSGFREAGIPDPTSYKD